MMSRSAGPVSAPDIIHEWGPNRISVDPHLSSRDRCACDKHFPQGVRPVQADGTARGAEFWQLTHGWRNPHSVASRVHTLLTQGKEIRRKVRPRGKPIREGPRPS